ncbi:MAG: amidohydrolase family protein [bacterium]|nr:amidohydrolase family protein [bacterium]
MHDEEHYKTIDLPLYRERIAPALPPAVLDFHTHIWTRDHWRILPWKEGAAGGNYMVIEVEYGVERLLADGCRLFPDRPYRAVAFGQPLPSADVARSNAYAAAAGAYPGVFPLLLAGLGLASREELEQAVLEGGFFGYKVFLNWHGDDYGDVTVEDQIGPVEMEVADAHGLVVLLHVPRSGRLADPVIQQGVRDCAQQYPNACLVLAHCGRCYHPDEMRAAVGAVRDLENVCLDTSMVMEPAVLQILMNEIDSRRLLFATDFPVAMMRGRRMYALDHWVDLVTEGYAPSAYRVAGDNFRATFMAYEIVLAILRAAELTGLAEEETARIFHDNGMDLLSRVRQGRTLKNARARWPKTEAGGG